MYSKSLVFLAATLPGLMTGCNNEQNTQGNEPSATDKNRTIVIDPNTGERRAPTREELGAIKQQSRTIESPDAKVVENEDGSTTVIYNGGMRKPLKATVTEDGEKKIAH